MQHVKFIEPHSILPSPQTAYHHKCCWQTSHQLWKPLPPVESSFPKAMLRRPARVRSQFDNECWKIPQGKHLNEWHIKIQRSSLWVCSWREDRTEKVNEQIDKNDKHCACGFFQEEFDIHSRLRRDQTFVQPK